MRGEKVHRPMVRLNLIFSSQTYFHRISVLNVKILSPLIQNSPPTEQRGRFCSASVPIGRSLVHSPPHDHGRGGVAGTDVLRCCCEGLRVAAAFWLRIHVLAGPRPAARLAPMSTRRLHAFEASPERQHQPSPQLAIGLAATVTSGRVSPPVIFKSASHLNHFTVILLSTFEPFQAT